MLHWRWTERRARTGAGALDTPTQWTQWTRWTRKRKRYAFPARHAGAGPNAPCVARPPAPCRHARSDRQQKRDRTGDPSPVPSCPRPLRPPAAPAPPPATA
ncbi:hypothetical protein RSSE_p1039 (plasmid) [Ralstonia solanacearum]|nr:hypothetical protein RSSE_p1039 [Ralstonia solanacearum]